MAKEPWLIQGHSPLYYKEIAHWQLTLRFWSSKLILNPLHQTPLYQSCPQARSLHPALVKVTFTLESISIRLNFVGLVNFCWGYFYCGCLTQLEYSGTQISKVCVGFPTPISNSWTPCWCPRTRLLLTLSTQRWHQIPQIEGSVLGDNCLCAPYFRGQLQAQVATCASDQPALDWRFPWTLP